MTDTPNQVLCGGCKEWYDARAPACYLCGHERPEVNVALKNAIAAERMNGALARQAGYARAEAAAESQFRQARNTGNADLANRPLTNYPNYGSLVGSIKQQLSDANFGG